MRKRVVKQGDAIRIGQPVCAKLLGESDLCLQRVVGKRSQLPLNPLGEKLPCFVLQINVGIKCSPREGPITQRVPARRRCIANRRFSRAQRLLIRRQLAQSVDAKQGLAQLHHETPVDLDRPAAQIRRVNRKGLFLVVPDKVEIVTFYETQQFGRKVRVTALHLNRRPLRGEVGPFRALFDELRNRNRVPSAGRG